MSFLFLYRNNTMATVHRLLSDEGKAVAREKARARYQRTRDARKRQAYLRVLRQIKKPKKSTLESHGFRETPEGWMDLDGQVVLFSMPESPRPSPAAP